MSDYKLKQEQERIERDSIQRGIDRYTAALDKEEARGREFDTPVAERLLNKAVKAVIPKMIALQAQGLAKSLAPTGGRPTPWGLKINLVSPEVLAYVTVKSSVVCGGTGRRMQMVTSHVGRMLQYEYWWNEARVKEKASTKARGNLPPNRLDGLKAKVKEVNPRYVSKWIKTLDDLAIASWSQADRVQVGSACLEAALPELGNILTIENVRRQHGRGIVEEKVVVLAHEFTEALREAHGEVAMMRPWLVPMVVSPTEWEESGGVLTGGYRLLDVDMLKAVNHHHTSVEAIPTEVISALNKLQSTPWLINKFVLDIAQDCFAHDLGPLPYAPPVPFPELIDDDRWAAMTTQERSKAKAERALVYTHNSVQEEKKLALTRAITVAERFKDYEAIYFPHSIDWRGRAYPIPQDLQPQGTDLVKSMLTFATGKPLGSSGWTWLLRHAASCFGLDKHDRDTQEVWALNNWDTLIGVGTNPWMFVDFWFKADEPWQFLAVCHELALAEESGAPEDYVSSLPVGLDGSCNGLQHLSAMGLDPVGAKAVNLLPGAREDVYRIVADKAEASIAADIAAAHAKKQKASPAAYAFEPGTVTRKVVKRGVMTTPYGVTPRGISKQLQEGGLMPAGDNLANSNYLRDHMGAAINDTIVVGKEIMGWMQSCAEMLAKEAQGISWVTPLGLKVTQCYTRPATTRVRTLMGRLYLDSVGNANDVIVGKQKHGVAPNVIHSFDASHMMMVVLNMPEDTSFAMIHDSFGCHACDVDTLLEVTKETFVEIYSHDWFEILKSDFTFFSDRQSLPPAPELGSLDITQVLESEYFFS